MTRGPRHLAAVLAAVAMVLVPLAPAVASVDTRDLQRELRCPTCNTPLDESNAPIAQRMKAFIQVRADKGWSDDRIKDALVAEFGREVLATPPKEGFDLVAWVVPGAAVALGLAAIPVITRRWAKRGNRPAVAGVDASPEEMARLDEELHRFQD